MKGKFKDIENRLKELGITSRFGAFPKELIIKIEQKYNIKLPIDYSEFLMEFGTVNIDHEICFPLLNKYPSARSDGTEGIVNFYGFQEGESNLFKIIDRYIGRMPTTLIPIAESPGGDQLCIGVGEETWGKIYYWDHEQERMHPSIQELWDNVYLTAHSFTDFILSFKVRLEVESESPKVVSIKMSDEFLKLMKKTKNNQSE
ncbi:SMI1/KNR4 family protein [Paenibacillus periandrae]|uniref:SMI1/KNR4 family protein n=1 Tax=Paenibacillus periandrae TaxID=1761741 RepID=UPI001F08D389|nr:SMI1/KNR4 family protein [Paenibacillus periandrae]